MRKPSRILPELLKGRESAAICRGMIAEKGALTEEFTYLEDYVNAG